MESVYSEGVPFGVSTPNMSTILNGGTPTPKKFRVREINSIHLSDVKSSPNLTVKYILQIRQKVVYIYRQKTGSIGVYLQAYEKHYNAPWLLFSIHINMQTTTTIRTCVHIQFKQQKSTVDEKITSKFNYEMLRRLIFWYGQVKRLTTSQLCLDENNNNNNNNYYYYYYYTRLTAIFQDNPGKPYPFLGSTP